MRAQAATVTIAMALAATAATPQGEELMEELREAHYPTRPMDADQVYEALEAIEGATDIFTGRALPRPLKERGGYTCVLPAEWWRDAAAGLDLHNIRACDGEVNSLKGSAAPGRVDNSRYDNGIWRAGTRMAGDVAISSYTPPTGYEGDFARAALYVITMYGDSELNGGDAFNFVGMSRWPGIEATSLRQLIAWHESDPADSREQERDAAIEAAQGNFNPYVRDASLVRRVFAPEEQGVAEETPLRGVYYLSDRRICLSSPYISAGAQWQYDGREVSGEVVLGPDDVGRHTLTYIDGDEEGTLIIEVRR